LPSSIVKTIWLERLPRAEAIRTERGFIDAILAGANEHDASDIAKVMERRPRPTYEERMAVFSPTGRPKPSRGRSLNGQC
jgi:hypothetical protein